MGFQSKYNAECSPILTQISKPAIAILLVWTASTRRPERVHEARIRVESSRGNPICRPSDLGSYFELYMTQRSERRGRNQRGNAAVAILHRALVLGINLPRAVQ